VLGLTSTAQSRILKGTVAAAPNASTTILPHIVVAKTTEGQKEDSALFNPRYVPPPPVDSSNLNTNTTTPVTNNTPAQVQSGGVVESNYQYKTPDSKPYVDGAGSVSTQPDNYHKPKQVDDGVETYQYKTPNGVVTDPTALAAAANSGSLTPKAVTKWHSTKTIWKKPSTANNSVANGTYFPKASVPVYASMPSNVATQSTQTLTPSINSNNNIPATYNNTPSENVVQRTDYKIEITTDGKFTVTFYNNGSNIVVTSFGRIAGVSTPASGSSITQQYDYRGLLQSVGGSPLQYTYEGRLQSVGSTNLSYNYNGNIQSIGNTPIYYNYNGTVDKIGNTKVVYDTNGSVSGTNGANPMITIKQ